MPSNYLIQINTVDQLLRSGTCHLSGSNASGGLQQCLPFDEGARGASFLFTRIDQHGKKDLTPYGSLPLSGSDTILSCWPGVQRGSLDAKSATESVSGLKAACGEALTSMEDQLAAATKALNQIQQINKSSDWNFLPSWTARTSRQGS